MITHAGVFRGSRKRTLANSLSIALIATLVAGCATHNQEPRPFFQAEQDRDTHGRKTLFDHVVEVDPGHAKTVIAANYQDLAPERIAVLPFVDHGSAQYVVDKIPLSFRNEKQRQEWAWTYANRLRRAVTGQLAQREFEVVPIVAIDTVLADRGIDNWDKLKAVPPEQLGRWLGADTVVYGEVTDYEAYYALLISSWTVGVNVRVVSTNNGEQLFAAGDRRYAVNIAPAMDPMDIAINSGLSLLELRDVTLARAEEEVSREIALRLPVSNRAVEELCDTAVDRAREASSDPTETSIAPSVLSTNYVQSGADSGQH